MVKVIMIKDISSSIAHSLSSNRESLPSSMCDSKFSFDWFYRSLVVVMMACFTLACEPTAEDLPLPTPKCLNVENRDRPPLLNEEDAQFMNGHWEIVIHTCNDTQTIKGLESYIHIESDLLVLDVQGRSLLLKLPNPKIDSTHSFEDLLPGTREDEEPLLIDVEIGPWIIGESVHFRLQRESQEESSETLQDEVQEDSQEEFPENAQLSEEVASWGTFKMDMLPMNVIADNSPQAQRIINETGW